MGKITLRDATINDRDAAFHLFEQIQNLHAKNHPKIFKQAKDNEGFTQFYEKVLNSEAEKLIFALEEDKPIAYIHYFVGYKFETIFNARYPYAFIYQVIVDAENRKKGVARMLLEHAKKHAHEFGAIGMAIDHFSFNNAARHCFESVGFKINREFMWLDI